MNLADKIISFNKTLEFTGNLPEYVEVMNPFVDTKYALKISSSFYKKYYNDNKKRRIILGINPGRFGAGVTGIPFTDTKRLTEKCNIEFPGISTHELSSVFLYNMIGVYGGVKKFYNDFYINSVSPLGFLLLKGNNNKVNFNYYDSKDLKTISKPFIMDKLQEQINFGLDNDVCYCLGKGKNYKYLSKLNKEHNFFNSIIPLEHPRYIVQYKKKNIDDYIDKYIKILKEKY